MKNDDMIGEEPFRIKVIEHIRLPERSERAELLKKAFYSIFYLQSEDVYIDLLTDSGAGAMSDVQWSSLMRGDEAYAGSRNYAHFEQTIIDITSYPYVMPTHQGRAAENILFELLIKPGDFVISNTFSDTTRAQVINRQATPLDLIKNELWDFQSNSPFKGNFDLEQLQIALERYHTRIPFILITIVNNLACSSPVSMTNIKAVREIAKKFQKPVFFDACRFPENAYLIKEREPGYENKSIQEIIHELFSYGDGCYMSAKKGALVNIGGFIALNDENLYRHSQEYLVLYEGFPTCGGLACRDLEALAIGLREGIDETYLKYRINQVAYLGELFEKEAGVIISKPTGGSGVFVEAKSIYPHLSDDELPGIALAADLYLEGGIRIVSAQFKLNLIDINSGEITHKKFELSRFAIPRRVYTKSHIEYIARIMKKVKENAKNNRGYYLISPTTGAESLAHFFAKFKPI